MLFINGSLVVIISVSIFENGAKFTKFTNICSVKMSKAHNFFYKIFKRSLPKALSG